jgi:peptide/nickel transport system substrate-binding protein
MTLGREEELEMADGSQESPSVDFPDLQSVEKGLSRGQFVRAVSATAGATILVPMLGRGSSAWAASLDRPAGSVIKPGGTLKAAIGGEPDSLDPAIGTNYATWQVFGNIFSTLVQIQDNGKFTGVLAKSWTSPNPTTYVFNLRDDVYFHNGEKFTADDVKYTLARVQNPKMGSFAKPLFDPVASVDVTSPTQVVFHLKHPFGPFLINLGQHLQIVNQKAIESTDPARHPIGTGAFTFVEWVQGDHLTIAKNTKYFIPNRPYLDSVVFAFRPADESRILALKSGDLNWADGVPLQDIKSLKSNPEFTYVTSSAIGIPDELRFQCTKPPFNNKALRQAVAWAIDRNAIRNVAYFGTGELGVEEFGSASPWYTGGAGVNPYAKAPNVKKAKALLAKAGLASGVKVECITISTFPTYVKTALVVQQNLNAIGIDMKITQLGQSDWLARYSKGNFQMLTGSYTGITDPDVFWSFETAPGNWNHYSNPQVNSLVQKARNATNLATRKALYKQVRTLVAEDVPVAFTHYETIQYLMAKNVIGSKPHLDLNLRFENVGFSG